MSPQIACIVRSILTLVAFLWLFSTVCFQMCPQFTYPRGCIVTLVAFVWLFSTVLFQMSPQMASMRRGIVTLIALGWFCNIVFLIHKVFYIYICYAWYIICSFHFFGFSPLCAFKCLLKLILSKAGKSHCLHLFDFLNLFILFVMIFPFVSFKYESYSWRSCSIITVWYLLQNGGLKLSIIYKTSQELRMLSTVPLDCQVTKIVMNLGSQL